MGDIGFSDQAPSLPTGGGAIGSLGATFTPDLSTGTGSFNIPFDTPNGPNDIGPSLGLYYDTAAGNGPFGLGFRLALPRLILDTEQGFPKYDGSDMLLLEGAGPLLALGGGAYRSKVDGGAWRTQASGDGFRLTDRAGLYYYLGAAAEARISDPANPAHVFAWNLERIEDALGNAATFSWNRDGSVLYLDRVSYGRYEIRFTYEQRPDPIRSGRSGFTLITGKRCTQVELHLVGAAQPVLRRWTLGYTEDPANGVSLLSSVTLSGIGENGNSTDAPPLRFTYSTFGQPALSRLNATSETALPPLVLSQTRRVEIVDWRGTGLPDILEITGGGQALLWTNMGNMDLVGPELVGTLPAFAHADASIAFVDMNGDGMADLVRFDRPLDGYIPREGGSFSLPQSWPQVPALPPSSPNVRMADLNGDGIVDMLSSSDTGLILYLRADEGWQPIPQVVEKATAPVVDLADPHVFLADMTGDGSQDIVRVDGSGVTYWPYLGAGRWDAPVAMKNSPSLPYDLRPNRLFLTDIDGDGCADLVYIEATGITYWINRSGVSFSPPRSIEYVPGAMIEQPRFADMTGSGTPGLLWSQSGPFGRGTQYFYLDFVGETKPRLLTKIDNGVGLNTVITYTTSAREAADAARSGLPWATSLPIALPVIKSVVATDASTGRTRTTQYRYRDGRFDGVLREFAGFGQVDQEDIGDLSIPTLLTSSWFHIGIDPLAPQAHLDEEERHKLRAIRGRCYKRERYGEDSSELAPLPYDRTEYLWDVTASSTLAGSVYIPRLVKTTTTTFERGASPASVITSTNSNWDSNGNVIDATEVAVIPGGAAPAQTLHTVTMYATDPNGRFLSKIFRVKQSDGTGTIIGDQITIYDGSPEGQVGTKGLVTKRSALVLTDAMVSNVYGTSAPDFAALHYYRRSDRQGWWIDQAKYVRTDDSQGLRGVITGPNGDSFEVVYDETKSYPASMTDPCGNSIHSTYDYRVSRVATLMDASGANFSASFDALARILARVEPGDTNSLPTLAFAYNVSQLPISETQHLRTESGAPSTIDTRVFYDGESMPIESRMADEAGEIATASRVYNSRGLLIRDHVPWRPSSGAYTVPSQSVPHSAFTYDALGRILVHKNAEGHLSTKTYGPRTISETDGEGKVSKKTLNAAGRIMEIEESINGRLLHTSYEYDVKGNLVKQTDATGNVVRTWYDALGRVLRVLRPEHDMINVYDAVGNVVEARTGNNTMIARRTYDACNRPVTVSTPSSPDPVIRFTYHDANKPAPPDAGVHTSGGRCVRVDDESGSTIFDYDERGRTILKRNTPSGMTRQFELRLAYRSDGRLSSITYPVGANGAPQLQLVYNYNKRGLLASIPGVIVSLGYDLDGRRTSVQYANGVKTEYAYDDLGRTTSLAHAGSGGTIRAAGYEWDGVGSLTKITSADPSVATTFKYDELHRLTGATTGSGDILTCSYDDIGNITNKSNVGEYKYGENGAPPTYLTSAGGAAFTYTPLGQMAQTPWGLQSFDSLGRLISITGTTNAAFRYDYAGSRAFSSFTVSNATTQRYTPDLLYSIDNGTLVRNLFDGVRIAAQDAEGMERKFLHEDHLGSTIAVTNSAGNVVDSIRYDAFGAVVSRGDPNSRVKVGFTGGEFDDPSGLLYLRARYYHPKFGRFVSVDPIVQDVFVPIAWNAYAYCRNNPQSYVDPTGTSWWQILVGALAVIAIAALVVVSIVTFGATTPLLVVGIGLVAGGIIGGVAAAQAGGSFGDIFLGILVGAAVGGWAAFGALYAGGAVASALGIKGTLTGAIVGGAINGAINGAAMGFAAGFAGGKTTFDKLMENVAMGALVGAIVGGALGALSYSITSSPAPKESVWEQTKQQLQSPAPGAGGAPPSIPSGAPQPPPTVINDPVQAAETVGEKLVMKAAAPAGNALLRYALTSPFATALITLVIDSAAGVWDLGYGKQLLQKIGVISYSTKF